MTTARDLTLKLGGRWHERLAYGTAKCPAHDDHDPSLSIRNGKRGVVFKCHSGCTGADVARALGLSTKWRVWSPRRDDLPKAVKSPERFADSVAAAIWFSGRPLPGTVGEVYLRSRAIVLNASERLRFHPALKHGPSGRYWPALVALVTTGIDDEPVGIHRTFLAKNGETKAPVTPAKMMLGSCAGGAVRLAPAAESLLIGEGIETVLSGMQATGRPGWAALGTSGLKALHLPEIVRNVTILVDGDDAGEEAAQVAALRWVAEGRKVKLARAPRGQDFNDLLLAERSA